MRIYLLCFKVEKKEEVKEIGGKKVKVTTTKHTTEKRTTTETSEVLFVSTTYLFLLVACPTH